MRLRFPSSLCICLLNLPALGVIAVAGSYCLWEAAATVFIGLLTLDVIWWQGHLIKRQLAFSTFIELDKEWNSREMLDVRKSVRDENGKWNLSNLEGPLEFFEKLASFSRCFRRAARVE